MKIKEILLNKWGWAGAVIGILFPSIMDSLHRTEFSSFEWGKFITFTVPILDFKIYLIYGVIGFILGLIANKLWRKFK